MSALVVCNIFCCLIQADHIVRLIGGSCSVPVAPLSKPSENRPNPPALLSGKPHFSISKLGVEPSTSIKASERSSTTPQRAYHTKGMQCVVTPQGVLV